VINPEKVELAQLRKELARGRAERDILKKALASLAKDPPRGSRSSPTIAVSGRRD